MLNMARLRRYVVAASSLLVLSHAQDPISNFCRRWGHSTAQVNGRLYIDGGMIDWNTANVNYTNTALIFSDLNASTSYGQPYQYANLSKPSEVPSVSGGILWPDEVNKCFYQFGGEFTNSTPTNVSIWTYDVMHNEWNQNPHKTSGPDFTSRVAYGAGTHIEDLGLGYYFGGYKNNKTDPAWTGSQIATSDLVRFDYTTGTLTNVSGPNDNVGRAEGQMVYLPASDNGILVYFGGVEDEIQNGSSTPANMSQILMYDVQSSKWYTQNATGDIPEARRQFCAGVTWADDQSSYNIYLYGGYGFGGTLAFDDAYILSIPSFTWIKTFPTNSTTGPYPHGGCSANVINRDQMLVIGGWFPENNPNFCDSPGIQGQHCMNLGYNGKNQLVWDRYDPSLSTYVVPTPIISAIGGGPTGGATKTAPATWDNPDLIVYYQLKAPSVTRTATRSLPQSTGTSSGSSGGSSKSRVGAIAGGVVGGVAGLIAIVCLVLYCLHRKKKPKEEEQQPAEMPPPAELSSPAELPPPVELDVTTPPQEMPATETTETGKYMSLLQQQELYSRYSGIVSKHSPHSLHRQQSSGTELPPYASPYGSADGANYPQLAYPQLAHAQSPSWEHAQLSTVDTRYSQYSRSSPSPLSHPSYATPAEAQLYYPPPREPAQQTRTNCSAACGGYNFVQHHDHAAPVLAPPPPVSAVPTPTHFYARPVSFPGVELPGYAPPPNDDDGSHGNEVEVHAPRRPKHGRFVEVDYA